MHTKSPGRRNADIAVRFQIQLYEGLVAYRLPDFANSIYATPAFIEQHSFTGPAPTARWIVLGTKGTLASWRDDSIYSN
ncbi:MAG: hypothetical protein ACU0C9_03955 [Paracoccaceae bacterium]